MAEIPQTIDFDAVKAALESLGIPVNRDLYSVTINAGSITFEQVRRDETGNLVASGDHVATVTTEIGLTRG